MKVQRLNNSIIIEDSLPSNHKKTTIALPPRVKPSYILKNIIELTEENDPNHIPHNNDPSISYPPAIARFQQQNGLGCLSRYLKCIVNTWKFVTKSTKTVSIDIQEADFSTIVDKINEKAQNHKKILPGQKEHKKVLVLDLDETLVHTTFSKPSKYDYELEIIFNGRLTKIYTVKRFGLDAFLFEMSKLYEIVLFTASQKTYADKVINLIDPKKRISHRLYRQHCVVVNQTYYIKSIKNLGRNLQDIIIVDDNHLAGLLQPNNFYKIDSFEGSQKDRYLCRLSAFLKYIYYKPTINSIEEEKKLFQNLQIFVLDEESPLGKEESVIVEESVVKGGEKRSLVDRKRQYRHKKTSSEVQALVMENDESQQGDGSITVSALIKKH